MAKNIMTSEENIEIGWKILVIASIIRIRVRKEYIDNSMESVLFFSIIITSSSLI